MANINLLPWREELRQKNQRDYISILGLVVVLGIVVIIAVYTIYENKLENQRQRNDYLQGEIRKLDSRIKEIDALEKERTELVERMSIIQDLQKSRPQVVHIFDEIVSTIPEGVNLSSVKRIGDKLIFNGIAESSPRISTFMRNIGVSKWIKQDKLEAINPDKGSGTNRKNFVLITKVIAPSKSEEVKP